MADSRPSVGVALVGSGFSASFHAENYKRVYGIDVRLAGVYSRRPEMAQKFAREHRLGLVYRSPGELLSNTSVDLVDACVPNRFHEEIVVTTLQARKHVVVEKPLTCCVVPPGQGGHTSEDCLKTALAGAQRMVQAERASGRKIFYAENWVHAPGVQKANRLLASAGTTILRIVGEESHSGTHSPYAMRWETAGGGSLLNKGCHPLGAALYLKYEEGLRRLGRRIRPRWVSASVAT